MVDQGYRGHNYNGSDMVHVVRIMPKKSTRALRRRLKRRAAIKPTIGHSNIDNRMCRNHLIGTAGRQINLLPPSEGIPGRGRASAKSTGVFAGLANSKPNYFSIFCVFISPFMSRFEARSVSIYISEPTGESYALFFVIYSFSPLLQSIYGLFLQLTGSVVVVFCTFAVLPHCRKQMASLQKPS